MGKKNIRTKFKEYVFGILFFGELEEEKAYNKTKLAT
jgi:hypothetical protein